MKLDPQKCPVGTVGFIPPAHSGDFEGDDFEWFKKPYVTLGEDRRWRTDSEHGEQRIDAPVYSDWKEAALHTLDIEAKQANEQIAVATKWLNDVQNLAKRINEAE